MSDIKYCLRFWEAVLAVVAKRLCQEWSCCSCCWFGDSFCASVSVYLLSSIVCMFWLLLSRNKTLSKVCDLKTILIYCLVTKERGSWRVVHRLQKRMWWKQPPLSLQCSLGGSWEEGREVCWWIEDEKWAEQVLEGKWGWRGAGVAVTERSAAPAERK